MENQGGNFKPGTPGESRTAGGRKREEAFHLEIDERSLATGPVELPERRTKGEARASGPSGSYDAEKERRAEEKAHKKRNKLKARKNKRVFSLMWLVMVLLVSFTLASYLIGGANDFFAVGRIQGSAEVEIPEKVTIDQLTEILVQKGIVNKAEFFKLYCKVTAEEELFVPGKYKLATNLDYEEIIDKLQGGEENREVVRITFQEGLTALEVAALLEENKVCTAEEFLKTLNEGDFSNYELVAPLSESSGKYYRLEGYLFPDTYDFYVGEELESVIGKLLNNFGNRLTTDMKNAIQKSNMTLDQIVTLASIIQAEAADANDMFKVSAVLHNRLSFGAEYGVPMLQCDSTIYYPYTERQTVPETGALPYGDYNTYNFDGLPAGAICNPGVDAIRAALSPSTDGDASSYLFFCHAADGTAYYATNEEDHIYNQYEAGLLE